VADENITCEGQRLLCAVPSALRNIAKATGLARASISEWRRGQKKPGRNAREILSKELSIPVDSWDQPPEDPATLPPPEAAVEVPEALATDASLDNLAAANRLLREIRGAAAEPDLTGKTRAELVARELAVLKFRHDLEIRHLLSQDKIVASHPEWLRVRTALTEVCGKCDRCSQQLIQALTDLAV